MVSKGSKRATEGVFHVIQHAIACLTILLSLCLITGAAQATTIAYLPLLQVTDRTDLWVRATVHDADFRSLNDDERARFGMEGTVEVTATLRIIDSAPVLDTSEINLHWATVDDMREYINSADEVIVALKERPDGTYATLYAAGRHGWLSVDAKSASINHVPEFGGAVPADLVWDLVRELRDALDAPTLDPAMGERWREQIAKPDARAFAAASVLFEAFPNLAPEPSAYIDAFARNQADYTVLPALAVLQRIATPEAVGKLLDYYEKGLASRDPAFDRQPTEVMEAIARLVAERGGPERASILKDLVVRRVELRSPTGAKLGEKRLLVANSPILRQLATVPGEDMDALLLDMLHHPDTFEISSVLDLAGLWDGLAKRGVSEIEPYLRAFLKNPDTTTLGVPAGRRDNQAVIYARESLAEAAKQRSHEHYLETLFWLYENGDERRLERFLIEIQPGDHAFVPKLTAIPTTTLLDPSLAHRFCGAAEVLAAPALLPQLRAIAKADTRGVAVGALFACGDGETAKELALEILNRNPASDWGMLNNEIYGLVGILTALGNQRDSTLVPIIERFTRAKVIENYDKALRIAARRAKAEYYDFSLRQLRQAAILALVHAGGDAVVPRLRELYDEEDIAVRIAAAMALHALGDDTGAPLVRQFAEHRELENDAIRARWRIDLGGGSGGFHYAVRILKSPRTDALFLERLQRGFGPGDEAIAGRPDLFAEHEELVLRALLAGLAHEDATVRNRAHRTLQRNTNQDFGYDPERPVKVQVDELEAWQAWVGKSAAGH